MAADIDVLICIDGTHDGWRYRRPEIYDAEFVKSHVRWIYQKSLFRDNSIYIRGPDTPGMDVRKLFADGLKFIASVAQKNTSGAINLNFCGYSRGGAIALDLANEMSKASEPRAVSYSGDLGTLLSETRKSLTGRANVKTLIMFDAVDMSGVINGGTVSQSIGKVAHVVRSKLWGSRNGWGNVGITLEQGRFEPGRSRPPYLQEIHCTHAAMGGLPCTGDIPKPLAKELLNLPASAVDWFLIQNRYLNKANPGKGRPGIVDATGQKSLYDPSQGVWKSAPPYMEWEVPRNAYTEYYGQNPGIKGLLDAYYHDSGGGRGSWHGLNNSSLGGLQGLADLFSESPRAAEIIAKYQLVDRFGSHQAFNWIRKTMGADFPAKQVDGG